MYPALDRQLPGLTFFWYQETAANAKKPSEIGQGPDKKQDKNENLEIKSIGRTEMVIRSPLLLEALRAVVKYYPSQQLTGSTTTIPEPYHFLLHHREELRNHAEAIERQNNGGVDNAKKNKTASDIRILLAFLDAKYSKEIKEEEARYQKTPPTATFQMMWLLLKPGTKVCANVGDNQKGAFVIRAISPEKPFDPEWYEVELWHLDFDGDF